MDTARYYIALFTVVGFPPIVATWLLIHPLIRLWRRIGAAATYMIVGSLILAAMTAIYRARSLWLAVRYDTHWIFVVLAIAAFGLALYLRVLLGRQFAIMTLLGLPELSADSGRRRLITEGIYARIRHPRYVEGALVLTAIALYANYLATWLVLAGYFPVIYLVVILEERELRQHFGADYENYCRRVPRFLPRLGRRAP